MIGLVNADSHSSASRSGTCRTATVFSLILIAVLGTLSIGTGCLIGGCTKDEQKAVATNAQAFQKAVVTDISSPAGQEILATAASAALNVGLDLAAGNDTGAAIAGIQGAASALRSYEGLPVAPSSVVIGQAAALGSGVTSVALGIAPSVEAIVENANQSAKTKGVILKADAITEAVARGLDAVAGAKVSAATGRAQGLALVSLNGIGGEAP